MTHRHQRGWLKKEKRSQGETWVLFFRRVGRLTVSESKTKSQLASAACAKSISQFRNGPSGMASISIRPAFTRGTSVKASLASSRSSAGRDHVGVRERSRE